MPETLGDKVQVIASFSNGQLTPRLFTRKGQEYPLKRSVFSFQRQEGTTPLLYFSVEGETATYELEFNLKTFIWRLTKVYLPGD